jgi:hypothetical protein
VLRRALIGEGPIAEGAARLMVPEAAFRRPAEVVAIEIPRER